MSYTVHCVLKSGVRRFNQLITTEEMPVAGDHITVYYALKNAFLETRQVFSGSVDEFVRIGACYGLSSRKLRNGFEELVKYGMLIINDDVFTPTDVFVKKFS